MLITFQLPQELVHAFNEAMMWQSPEVRTRKLKEKYWPKRNEWLRNQMNAILGHDGWFNAEVVSTNKPYWNAKNASAIFVTVAYRVEQHLQYFEDVH